jgi:4,5-dihydroxyphthalate decarboxylase
VLDEEAEMTHNLSIVLGRHGQAEDLRTHAVPVGDYELEFVDVRRMPDAYRDMARTQPYDICEMAPTTYLMALAAGAPVTALPIPMTRRFRHAGLLARRTSTIRQPVDIEGRRVGVRTYAVTAAVWTRGIYAEEFSVDLDQVTWLTAEEENVRGFPLPPNVSRIDPGDTLARMLRDGEIDAAFAGPAGAGADPGGEFTDLIADAERQEREWFARTGIYPLHGVIVVRDEVLDRDPGLARTLFDAFSQAKENYLARITSGAAALPEDLRYLRLSEFVGDPLPYGLAENAKSLAALVRYAHRQRLIPDEPPIDAVFPDPRGVPPCGRQRRPAEENPAGGSR